jgi:hypothetical protein
MTRRQALRYQRFPVARVIWQKPAIRPAAPRPDPRTARVTWGVPMSPSIAALNAWRLPQPDPGEVISIPLPGVDVVVDGVRVAARQAGTFRITAVTDTSLTIAPL